MLLQAVWKSEVFDQSANTWFFKTTSKQKQNTHFALRSSIIKAISDKSLTAEAELELRVSLPSFKMLRG